MPIDSKKTQAASPGARKKIRREEALTYHARARPGKIEVVPTKPYSTARDLALASSPGIVEPSQEIGRDPDLSYTYTARGNLVAVITNGTAVPGLGDVGPRAAKPVAEGKAVLFKKFADIDVFDIDLDVRDVDHFCTVVKALEPTFGGIDLEYVKAPECFLIEERLTAEMQIPVLHGDRHGTAIVSGAALANALELAGKEMAAVRVVVAGDGASAIACARFYLRLGVKKENIVLVDSLGVIYQGRNEAMNSWKAEFAAETRCRTLADALEGADVFVGCSARGTVTPRMIQSMARDPIVFALASPEPEIEYREAKQARDDVIVATGRSDSPNQVDGVLGFPFLFRGALDVRARAITEEMKMAATRALAALAREEVPESVSRAYGGARFGFDRDYIIPKPLDPRALYWVAPAVAKAAMDGGVARQKIDLVEYRERLRKTQSRAHAVMSGIFAKARATKLARIVFPESDHEKILQATQTLRDEGICEPILLGPVERIRAAIAERHLEGLEGVAVVNPVESREYDRYVSRLWDLRSRKGMTLERARQRLRTRSYFAAMMVNEGAADGLVTGLTVAYADAIRAALEVIGTRDGRRAAGVYVVVTKNDLKFFADCTVNVDPTAQELADIALATADLASSFDMKPRVAMLSYSTFGSARGASPSKVREATELVRRQRPHLEVDGEIQADVAVTSELRGPVFPVTTLRDDANVLVFPNLDAANSAYQLVERIGGAEVIGPVLLGMAKPVNVLRMNCSVQSIVNLATITALRTQGEPFVF